jgi:UTP--glucose-1-phosphate uridylyltransferase
MDMKNNMSQVKKAIIPVAGLGTRMLPATKAIPKEMLPLVDKPLIQYVVNECVQAGIKEIILVTHASKNSIENHFDTSYELEATLEMRVKRQLLEEVQQIIPKDVTIMHVRQKIPKGLGHAVLCARSLVGDAPFAVVLPDVIIDEFECDLKKHNLADMISIFNSTQLSQVMVENVSPNSVDQYGIVDINNESIKSGERKKIFSVVEKPDVDDAPSTLAVVGRYVLSNAAWDLLEHTPPGAGDEIQLTDAISVLIKLEDVQAYCLVGRSHDCGSKIGYMKANLEYGIRHPDFGQEFKKFVTSVI